MNRFGIVLATYNGERFLEDMLLSLTRQSHQADWIIAVDDGSKDKTLQILETFKDRLPLEIYVNETNRGHRATFEKGLQLAMKKATPGDFIALADQDDIWKEHKLEILLSQIQNNALIFGDAEIIDSKNKKTYDSWRKYALIEKEISMMSQIAGINNVTGCLCLFKADLLGKILPIPQGVTVHDRWIAMIAERNGGIKAIDETVVQYRIHEANALGGKPVPPMSKTLAEQEMWLQMILANKDRLSLRTHEVSFTKKLLQLVKFRQQKYAVVSFLPWIFKNRKILFLKSNKITTLKRVLFSAVGLPLAHILWKKS